MTTKDLSRPHWVVTLATPDQIKKELTQGFLHGHREPRLAVVGRSNVGKSSLINSLLKAGLAQTSAEPGKTRAIHAYFWPALGGEKNPSVVLVDLPGYGYAKTSHSDRERWAQFIEFYLKTDPGIAAALVLLDGRHGPTANDVEAIQFLLKFGFDLIPVMTKSDQIKTQKDRSARQKEVRAQLSELGFPDDRRIYWTSTQGEGTGLDELKGEIRQCVTERKA
ncbi:MAG: ribosome biogenesis GTP-binding protein YsxC [Bdellovibrionales bacterium]|nr:ribosome biogenesis GTP-binding protein YsxC [Bdellovibrionales bacterium]